MLKLAEARRRKWRTFGGKASDPWNEPFFSLAAMVRSSIEDLHVMMSRIERGADGSDKPSNVCPKVARISPQMARMIAVIWDTYRPRRQYVFHGDGSRTHVTESIRPEQKESRGSGLFDGLNPADVYFLDKMAGFGGFDWIVSCTDRQVQEQGFYTDNQNAQRHDLLILHNVNTQNNGKYVFNKIKECWNITSIATRLRMVTGSNVSDCSPRPTRKRSISASTCSTSWTSRASASPWESEQAGEDRLKLELRLGWISKPRVKRKLKQVVSFAKVKARSWKQVCVSRKARSRKLPCPSKSSRVSSEASKRSGPTLRRKHTCSSTPEAALSRWGSRSPTSKP
mmetsp:Transcript_5040/g.7113  ORF Transcript_5040/g.7113 Transcript_5040/m.7113 type:complete len:340 (-) Transcript_5040:289-1308(-)